MTIETIVTTRSQPDLIPVVARWLWDAFWQHSGKPFEQLLAAARQTSTSRDAIPATFVCIDDGRPVGTASLIANDMDERAELSPWLAGVFVEPDFRGRGCATRLVCAVEDAAARAGIQTLWLHTTTAEALYGKIGWTRVEVVQRSGKRSVVMRKAVTR